MKKNFLFLKKYLLLTTLLYFGIFRAAAQEAAPTVESGWRAELGLFYAGASYEQRVASRFSLVGHFELFPEWGRMVYGNPNMKFGGLVPAFQLEGRWYYSGVRPGNSGGYLALRSDLAWNNARLWASNGPLSRILDSVCQSGDSIALPLSTGGSVGAIGI